MAIFLLKTAALFYLERMERPVLIKWIRPESKGALTPPHKRAVVLPDGSRALDQGDAPADLYSAGSTELGSCQEFGSALPAALLTASRHGALWQSRGVALICFYKAVAEGKNPP